MERKARNVLFNCCFAINCLLLFFLLFESRLVIPAWLQVTGRMHPLLLHFPIVLLIVYILWLLLIEKANTSIHYIGEWLLLLSALTASVTSLAGLFLSKETGYDSEALQWHKWSGITIALLTTLWYAFRNTVSKWKWTRLTVSFLTVAIVVFTGHQGAAITHGENFLLAPVTPEVIQPVIALEDAIVYTHMVQPILQKKCMGCHNSKKAKGELVMESEALLLKGGKNGKLWDSTAAGYGLLLSRLHLDTEIKEHMPPAGKPQLEEQELEILNEWVRSGANFKVKVNDLAANNPLRAIAANLFNGGDEPVYDFAAADEQRVRSLNTNYRLITPLAKESPALRVKFFGQEFYKPQQLSELLEIKNQVVDLNLDKMPVKDEELSTISQFSNLRRLGLAFTAITGKTVNELNKLHSLREVSLSGTGVSKENLQTLSSLKNLSQLFVWNTSLTDTDIEALKKMMKGVVIETGFNSDTGTMKLPAPILVNTESVIQVPFKVKLKHPINGVTIRYTLDGTEPDSLKSPEYKEGIEVTKSSPLKAKAYRKGWEPSEVLENYYFVSTYKPDSIFNLTQPDQQYKGNGAKTLIDEVKGNNDLAGTDKWLGYLNNKMETLMYFESSPKVSNVLLSTLLNTYGSIFPPVSVEIWGGDDRMHLKKITRFIPPQPSKHMPGGTKPVAINFAPVSVKYLKIIAEPVSKLPKWHDGKGKKGWILVDEVLVN